MAPVAETLPTVTMTSAEATTQMPSTAG